MYIQIKYDSIIFCLTKSIKSKKSKKKEEKKVYHSPFQSTHSEAEKISTIAIKSIRICNLSVFAYIKYYIWQVILFIFFATILLLFVRFNQDTISIWTSYMVRIVKIAQWNVILRLLCSQENLIFNCIVITNTYRTYLGSYDFSFLLNYGIILVNETY